MSTDEFHGVARSLAQSSVVRVLERGTDKPLGTVQDSAYAPSGRVLQRADSDSGRSMPTMA